MLIDASTGRSLTAALGALVTVAPASRIKGHARVSVAALHDTVLWLLVASGSLVLIEPSPYEALFAVAIVVFGASLRFDRSFVPLVLCLILFNLGGLLSLIPWTDDHDSVTFLFTSAYVSATAIFFACVTAERSLERLEIIRRAYIVAAVIGSVAGIAGYFDIGGLGDVFTKFDRATGTFKDPNVLGPFTVLALVWISQRILVGEIRRGTIAMATTILSFMIIAFALFLTFSRGA
ncbi:MAG: hypothetical protein JO163_08470, partial [Methylobacteriaceae bacterium]|nr:hypothetical protein [Methylobacteriaceae bacterium]